MYIHRRASQRSGKLMTNLLLHKSKSAFKCFLEKQKMKRIDFEIEICFPLILDSLFIFVFGFGIRGAAIATVISQFLSAAFIFMDLQYMGQTVFKSLNKKKQAIFFCLLRKVFIVVPLTYLFPYAFQMGTHGVFLAEPVSNVIGGSLCFVTMLLTVLPELKRMEN